MFILKTMGIIVAMAVLGIFVYTVYESGIISYLFGTRKNNYIDYYSSDDDSVPDLISPSSDNNFDKYV